MISFRRGEFALPEALWWRAGGSGLMALLLAPVIFFGLNAIAATVRHQTQPLRGALE